MRVKDIFTGRSCRGRTREVSLCLWYNQDACCITHVSGVPKVQSTLHINVEDYYALLTESLMRMKENANNNLEDSNKHFDGAI